MGRYHVRTSDDEDDRTFTVMEGGREVATCVDAETAARVKALMNSFSCAMDFEAGRTNGYSVSSHDLFAKVGRGYTQRDAWDRTHQHACAIAEEWKAYAEALSAPTPPQVHPMPIFDDKGVDGRMGVIKMPRFAKGYDVGHQLRLDSLIEHALVNETAYRRYAEEIAGHIDRVWGDLGDTPLDPDSDHVS
jgi:hypothetical protein